MSITGLLFIKIHNSSNDVNPNKVLAWSLFRTPRELCGLKEEEQTWTFLYINVIDNLPTASKFMRFERMLILPMVFFFSFRRGLNDGAQGTIKKSGKTYLGKGKHLIE